MERQKYSKNYVHRMKHYESDFDNSNIMDTDDVAEMFRFHRITILKLFREGTLPAVRVGPEWRAWRPNLIKLIKKGESL